MSPNPTLASAPIPNQSAAAETGGRFDREVAVPVPGPSQRAAILRLHARAMPLHADVSLAAVAARCHGYTGACRPA